MPDVAAIYHRTKEVNIYPLGGDRFLIEAFLQDEVHDVHAEVEILHPSLEIVAARSQVRNGPFTNVCNMTHPNMDRLVGMRVERGFTGTARKIVGGPVGCHRVSELLVEIAQAAYQLHFVRLFQSTPPEERAREDDPAAASRLRDGERTRHAQHVLLVQRGQPRPDRRARRAPAPARAAHAGAPHRRVLEGCQGLSR